MDRRLISIVIPAFNEERLLPATLDGVAAARLVFTREGLASELIVCDNNSTDRTAELAAAAGATVVFEPVNQISRARNAGAAAASGDWLLFIDADSHPSPELFTDVVAAIRDPQCLAGGATVTMDHASLGARMGLAGWNAVSRLFRWGAGSFIFCETAAFRAVGGFSEALYAAEEIDLFRRLKRLASRTGRRIVILRRHPLRTSGRKQHLYTPRELTAFMLKTVLTLGRTLRSPEASHVWYDGRR